MSEQYLEKNIIVQVDHDHHQGEPHHNANEVTLWHFYYRTSRAGPLRWTHETQLTVKQNSNSNPFASLYSQFYYFSTV